MNKAIIGRKVGMTQIFTPEGKVIPVTVVEAGPCPVVQIKTVEKDGYAALKLGFDETSEKRLNKPELGQFKKAGVKPQKVLKEFRLADLSSYEVGKEVTVGIFKEGEKVDVVGTSKGHGYTGVIKRWNQRRLKETHGVGPVHREVGSASTATSASPCRTLRSSRSTRRGTRCSSRALSPVRRGAWSRSATASKRNKEIRRYAYRKSI